MGVQKVEKSSGRAHSRQHKDEDLPDIDEGHTITNNYYFQHNDLSIKFTLDDIPPLNGGRGYKRWLT